MQHTTSSIFFFFRYIRTNLLSQSDLVSKVKTIYIQHNENHSGLTFAKEFYDRQYQKPFSGQ